jgi:hypothetical protein
VLSASKLASFTRMPPSTSTALPWLKHFVIFGFQLRKCSSTIQSIYLHLIFDILQFEISSLIQTGEKIEFEISSWKNPKSQVGNPFCWVRVVKNVISKWKKMKFPRIHSSGCSESTNFFPILSKLISQTKELEKSSSDR